MRASPHLIVSSKITAEWQTEPAMSPTMNAAHGVAVRHPLAALLVNVGADLRPDLSSASSREPGERLSKDGGVPGTHELAYEFLERQTRLGHRGAPLVVSRQQFRRL
jgi:hypothetical protein